MAIAMLPRSGGRSYDEDGRFEKLTLPGFHCAQLTICDATAT
jgi:hypothetical protein